LFAQAHYSNRKKKSCSGKLNLGAKEVAGFRLARFLCGKSRIVPPFWSSIESIRNSSHANRFIKTTTDNNNSIQTDRLIRLHADDHFPTPLSLSMSFANHRHAITESRKNEIRYAHSTRHA
jgi:hypothetical protein